MPTAQELKRVQEELDAQIAAAEKEEHEAEEARLWVEEEARVAAKKARLEEEAWEWEHGLRRRSGSRSSSSTCERRTSSWRSETSVRRGGLPGRGHRGNDSFCHRRILPEVRRKRRG